MRLLAPLFLMSLIFAACSDESGTKNTPPPTEMVGAWSEAVSVASSPGSSQDVCSGLSVLNNQVSSTLFKVDEFGNVYDGKNMTDANNPYRIIGTMDSTGKITPNALGREEFLGSFSSISGATLNPIVTTTFGFDPIKGQTFKMKIDLQIISNGQTVTQSWTERDYFKLTSATEQLWVTKAKQCLAKTKGFAP